MNIVLNIAIILNIILVLTFTILSFFIFKRDMKPKLRARLSTVIGTIMTFYILAILAVIIKGCIEAEYIYLLFFLFVASPFIIGYFVKYETLKKYTIIQIACFLISLILLLFFK